MSFTGVCFRFHDPKWATVPISGQGAARFGARFNPPGTEALYLAVSLDTAYSEVSQGRRIVPPYTLVCYEVNGADVIDLREEKKRDENDAPLQDLGCSWKQLASEGRTPPSWAVAAKLKRVSDGIIVPSFAHGAAAADCNLVLWRWHATVVAYDPDQRLPRNQSSWL